MSRGMKLFKKKKLTRLSLTSFSFNLLLFLQTHNKTNESTNTRNGIHKKWFRITILQLQLGHIRNSANVYIETRHSLKCHIKNFRLRFFEFEMKLLLCNWCNSICHNRKSANFQDRWIFSCMFRNKIGTKIKNKIIEVWPMYGFFGSFHFTSDNECLPESFFWSF